MNCCRYLFSADATLNNQTLHELKQFFQALYLGWRTETIMGVGCDLECDLTEEAKLCQLSEELHSNFTLLNQDGVAVPN
jgi:hypothetical protein